MAFGITMFHAGKGALFVLLWAPGFFTWYGYIRRAFGYHLFGRSYAVWVLSIIVNLGYFYFLFPIQHVDGDPQELIAQAWLTLAVILSILSWRRERKEPEPERIRPPTNPKLPEDEFRKLLDEHRHRDA